MAQRATFNLSHEHKTTCDMGQLIPVWTEEVLPGDTFRKRSSLLARVASLANPVMHTVDISMHDFYVPNRLLWDDWEDFITGQTSPTYPTLTNTTTALTDYMGIYPDTGLTIDAMPVRAYNLIYNEFYRDQDLTTARATDDLTLAQVSWGKDYFTTARPNAQQGSPISIGFSSGEVPVKGIGIVDGTATKTSSATVNESDGNQETYGANDRWDEVAILESATAGYPNIRVDLADSTTGIDINELRRSMALQRRAEARAFFGSRYVDYLRYIGVNPSDGRLQRPEYLGGRSERVAFSEVIATAEGTNTEVGDLAGHGIAGMRGRRYQKPFEEHGWVLTLLHVRPRTAYMQAMPKKFLRREATDFWQPELEVLPWQEVKQNEVHYNGSSSTIFGYVPRYDEYRQSLSHVSGAFRTTKKDWHMARDITSAPTLNASFVECDPTNRIYNVPGDPDVTLNVFHDIKARRLVRSNADFKGELA